VGKGDDYCVRYILKEKKCVNISAVSENASILIESKYNMIDFRRLRTLD
jgi:hypothetical protein